MESPARCTPKDFIVTVDGRTREVFTIPTTTAHLDYIQRTGLDLASISATGFTSAPPVARYLWHIRSIGSTGKQLTSEEKNQRPPTTGLLAGIHAYQLPIAFLISGSPAGVTLALGGWKPSHAPERISLQTHSEALKSALASVYPAIRCTQLATATSRSEFSGLALGAPSFRPSESFDRTLPVDRLIRALFGRTWSVLILAQPITEERVRAQRHALLNEQRVALSMEKAEGTPSPLTSHYVELLGLSTKAMTQGLALGMWRTSIYLLADALSYYPLEGTWRSLFSGPESLIEPVQAYECPEVGKLAARWALSDAPAKRGPGDFDHPYEFQSLLTSEQLGTYVHLPLVETSGFGIQSIPDFDAVPSVLTGPSVALGEIVVRGELSKNHYRVELESLAEHTLVAGVTGSGKTTSIFHLLKSAYQQHVPFLVIEPAKKEYRSLLNDAALKERLQIFTLGDEAVSPFRLNPFEKAPKTPIAIHLELLRSVFAASFGMWSPLPQVLEACIHAVYADCGWNLIYDANPRLTVGEPTASSFPTLTDLVAKVEEITPRLGYDSKIAGDIRAALVTRLNSLRVGGKGRMLDTRRTIPFDLVLDGPTVFELEDMGDDDDKAFMMGLLLIRIVEHLRIRGRQETLCNLLVLEEAHRLLANVGPTTSEQGSPRAKAIEAFTNMLAEVRAYGLGVIVSDQIPGKLVPDVIKNTNLKIAHRIVAGDDRTLLAGAMAMSPTQAQDLSVLERGEAAVFSRKDDAPLLVQFDKKAKPSGSWPDNEEVRRSRERLETTRALRPSGPALEDQVEGDPLASAIARIVAQSSLAERGTLQAFVTMVLSVVEDARMLPRLWDDMFVHVKRFRTAATDETLLRQWTAIEGTQLLVRSHARRNQWTYSQQQQTEDALGALLLAHVRRGSIATLVGEFTALWLALHARTFDPFPACEWICSGREPECRYRRAVEEFLVTEVSLRIFENAYAKDKNDGASLPRTHDHCSSMAKGVLQVLPSNRHSGDTAATRAMLCYAQQQLLAHSAEVREKVLRRISDQVTGGRHE